MPPLLIANLLIVIVNVNVCRHQRIHSGVRPYVCEHCHKSFIRLDALSRHLKVRYLNLHFKRLRNYSLTFLLQVDNGRGCKTRPLGRRPDDVVDTLLIPLTNQLPHEQQSQSGHLIPIHHHQHHQHLQHQFQNSVNKTSSHQRLLNEFAAISNSFTR